LYNLKPLDNMNKRKGAGNPNEIVLFMCGAMVIKNKLVLIYFNKNQ